MLVSRSLAATALVAGVALNVVLPADLADPGSAPAATTASPLGVELGLRVADPATGVAAAAAFSRSTGSRVDRLAVELPAATWREAAAVRRALAPFAGTGRRLELTVPLSADGSGEDYTGCAAGDQDARWQSLVGALVDHGLADAHLRPVPVTAASAGCFRRLATTARSVPGQEVGLLATASPSGVAEGYPGDAYVDALAVELTGPAAVRHLESVASFARARGKPVGITAWGPGGRDDPDHIDEVLDWVVDPAHDVVFADYVPHPGAPRSTDRYRVRASALAPLLGSAA